MLNNLKENPKTAEGCSLWQAGVNGAFTRDYFQRWRNTYLMRVNIYRSRLVYEEVKINHRAHVHRNHHVIQCKRVAHWCILNCFWTTFKMNGTREWVIVQFGYVANEVLNNPQDQFTVSFGLFVARVIRHTLEKNFFLLNNLKEILLKPFGTLKNRPLAVFKWKNVVAVNSSWHCNILALHAFTLFLAPVWLESQTDTWQWCVKLLCNVQAASLGAKTMSFSPVLPISF